MSEMVERVARRAFEKEAHRWLDNPKKGLQWKHLPEHTNQYGCDCKDFWREVARAAIEAMQEPTEGMVQAVRKSAPYDIDAAESWPIMIDEALR